MNHNDGDLSDRLRFLAEKKKKTLIPTVWDDIFATHVYFKQTEDFI